MSHDITFVSQTPVDSMALRERISVWAASQPHVLDHSSQLEYNNASTLVHGLFDISKPEDDDPEEPIEAIAGLHYTGCTGNLNYLRPEFFAAELTPAAADLARSIGALIYDPQDDVLYSPEDFEQVDPYLQHLKKINASYLRREEIGARPKAVKRNLLNGFWRQNFTKDALQRELGETVFVPTMALVRLKDEANPTTTITWARAIPMAFEQAGSVLLVREGRGWLKKSNEVRIAPFETFRSAVSASLRPLIGHETKMLLEEKAPGALEAPFDLLFDSLPKVRDLKTAMPERFGDLMAIVDVD